MIMIRNAPLDRAFADEYSPKSVEKSVFDTLFSSDVTYSYDSAEQLRFELRMRREIVAAANALLASGIAFRNFRDSKCNTEFWTRTENGGFELKRGAKPSDAIRDIFRNGRKYGTECATAMVIVYYKALLEIFPEEAFNRMFPDIYLMNWHQIDPQLREIGIMHRETDFLPGDRRYFKNPDVDPLSTQWQGENVIDVGGGLYYGHGIGKYRPNVFIDALNRKRREGATRSAYLMESAGRPNFRRLADLYARTVPAAAAAFRRLPAGTRPAFV